ncbi:hypothetical protein Fmac_015046 [Flemingia macrophylla]|uniref:BZIP domain-containing protein n=1 Tax=Flemingia macrophylla TaxID=520843 RepID=A0ABD1MDG0_9FABA
MLSSPTTAREHKPPSSAAATTTTTAPHKMMEDVWKDINININLTSLTDHHATSKAAKFQDFLQVRPSSPPASPLTALCLATHPESHIDLQLAQPHPHRTSTCKRPPTCPRETRHARLIKNRESAARSRARKQESIAYEFELQQKIKQLQEENARLRRQQQPLRETAANKQKGGKGNLYRTYTAPF